MGRLFWKFFFFFWLAQFLTSVGVGMTIWVLHEHSGSREWRSPPPPSSAANPPPAPGLSPRPPAPPERLTPRPLRPLVMPLIAGSIVSLLFAGLLAWYFARPIRTLRAAFEAVAAGKLDTRIGGALAGRRDELVDLGQDFDRMAERLEKLLEGQRRLLHDVSHELRSPLARLQAAADLLQQQPVRGAEIIGHIERDIARMDRLVGELLTLARVDVGTGGQMEDPVDLTELVADIAADARFEAEAKECRVEPMVVGTPVVPGNRDLLYRAVENVVRNALRHSSAGGEIAISVYPDRGGREVAIEIADQGPGVGEHELDAIFSPFVRGRAASGDGYGLGLAITRRVAEVHGGSVVAVNRPAGGLLVTLRLPLVRPAARA